MGFAINTNNDALNTYRNLTNVQNSLSKSLERLSSGLRINQAGDDAAGLTISTQMGSQISGLQQASRNAQDGTSLVQTADGALSQVQSLLGRLRDLAVQAGNDSNSGTARAAITTEAASIQDELTRLKGAVSFNGQNLLDGTAGTSGQLSFQVGAGSSAANQVSVDLRSANLTSVISGLKGSTTTVTINTPSDVTGKYKFSATTQGDVTINLTPASGTYSTVQQVADAINADTGNAGKYVASVNADNKLVVQAGDGTAVTITQAGTSGTDQGDGFDVIGTASAANGLKFDSAANAKVSIDLIDAQMSKISSARASIGAAENRFANVTATISTTVQNLTAAKSRITDVDMAQEMVNYTRANVLSQSGTAMLAQANSLPQLALKLLG